MDIETGNIIANLKLVDYVRKYTFMKQEHLHKNISVKPNCLLTFVLHSNNSFKNIHL